MTAAERAPGRRTWNDGSPTRQRRGLHGARARALLFCIGWPSGLGAGRRHLRETKAVAVRVKEGRETNNLTCVDSKIGLYLQ
jgi:hypothetical protein